MVTATNLGFPPIGPDRELKQAVEGDWKGELSRGALYDRAVMPQAHNTRLAW